MNWWAREKLERRLLKELTGIENELQRINEELVEKLAEDAH